MLWSPIRVIVNQERPGLGNSWTAATDRSGRWAQQMVDPDPECHNDKVNEFEAKNYFEAGQCSQARYLMRFGLAQGDRIAIATRHVHHILNVGRKSRPLGYLAMRIVPRKRIEPSANCHCCRYRDLRTLERTTDCKVCTKSKYFTYKTSKSILSSRH